MNFVPLLKSVAKELVALAAESQALKAILATAGTKGFAKRIFEKVFFTDINRLRSMEDMWKIREPPKPLVFDDIITQESKNHEAHSASLKDQIVWSLPEAVKVFCER